MSEYSIVSNAALTATANAIRTKSGSQATIEFDHNTGFKDAVDAITTGGTDYLAEVCNNTLSLYHSTEVTQLYGGYPFHSLPSLIGVVLPNLSAIRNFDQFNASTNLKYTDIGGTFERIQNRQYSGCAAFDTLIIRKTGSIAILGSVNAFDGTCFKSDGSGGTLYVPSALISSYQSATNWSTILGYANNSIVAIEGSQYENYYADGTPISA